MAKEVEADNITGLDALLRKVDYKSLENYKPGIFSIKFIEFVKLCNDGNPENISPLFHYQIMDDIQKYPNTLHIAFRGSAKTSLMEMLILYIAVFGKIDGFSDICLGMYVGDTMENGVKNMRNNLEFRYNNSEFLQKFVPKVKFTDPEWEFTNIDGHELTFRGFGVSSGVRGFKKYGQRPSIAIADDILSDRNADSKTVIGDIESIIYKAVRQAMHPKKRRMIWIGTPFNMSDPLYKAAGSRSWHTTVWPICQEWPCEKKDFVGAWPDRFTYKVVKDEYEMLKENGRIDAFNQELLLRIMTEEDRLILDEDIIWYKRINIMDNLKAYNIYITTDFATSESEKSDFSVISVWALGTDGVFRWIDGICERQNMSRNIDDLFRLCRIYNPLSVGVEISGQQKGFVSWIRKEMVDRKEFFHIASDKATGEEGLRPTTSKLVRFNTSLPLFKQRKIAFPEELKNGKVIQEFITELTAVTPAGFKSAHDDCADTISQIPLIQYFVPGEEKKFQEPTVFNDDIYFNYENNPFHTMNEYIV